MSTPSSILHSSEGQRILVVIAHPDDAESFCGGTLALLAKEGRDIEYLVITKGDILKCRCQLLVDTLTVSCRFLPGEQRFCSFMMNSREIQVKERFIRLAHPFIQHVYCLILPRFTLTL